MRRKHSKFAFGLLLLPAFFAGGAGGDGVAQAAPVRVRVRGAAKLAARASREQAQDQAAGINDLVLSGSLTDDAGQALPFQSVTIRVTREADPHDGRVAEGLRGARGCDRTNDTGDPAAPRRGPTAWGVRVAGPTDAPEVVVVSDESGRFCFRARLDPDRYKANLVFAPTATGPQALTLLDGTERELTFDLSKRGLALRFDPTPHIVAIDSPRLTLDAVAILDDDATPRVAPGLAITLENEKEQIARTVTDSTGRAHFIMAGSKLGAPGQGELRVSFTGDADTARASTTEEIERHVKVAVKVPAADRGELSPGVPEDGIPLTVEVGSSLGPISEGSVEARVGEVVVGAAPVERGIARLTLTFAAQGSEALVRLRYVPASPWFEPIGDPTIRIPIRGPSVMSKAPILIAGLAVLAFFLVGRVTARKNKPEPAAADNKDDRKEGKPRVDILRPAERGQEGWSGRVIDAHEGFPIRGARVWIERGTFEGRSVLATAETDADGRFSLSGIGRRTGDEMIASEGRLHARFAQDLPVPGELAISLAQRRRALLAKMVKWARRRGAPFDVRPEPTPGHVRRAATGDQGTARWADAVERAVFGPDAIDARAEQEVDRLAPAEDPGKAADLEVPRDLGRGPRR